MSRRVLRMQLAGMDERIPAASAITLSASIVDARGAARSTGTVSTGRTAALTYESGNEPLYAQIVLPNGTSQIQPLLKPDRSWQELVTFRIDERQQTFNWMVSWALRMDLRRIQGALRSLDGMADAWFQLWRRGRKDLRWRQSDLRRGIAALDSSPMAIQLHFLDSTEARVLVVHLGRDNPLVIALPSWQVKVLVTTVRGVSGAVRAKVLVGGYSHHAETIMEYLRAGRLDAAGALLEIDGELAHEILDNSAADPMAAVAAAYYFLRRRDWSRLSDRWLRQLEDTHKRLPDVRLILAMSRIERGMPTADAAALAAATLSDLLNAGFPLFAEARWLLNDLLALARTAETPLDPRVARRLGRILAAARPAGLSFAFAGARPTRPDVPQGAFLSLQGQLGHDLLGARFYQAIGLEHDAHALPYAGATGSKAKLFEDTIPPLGTNLNMLQLPPPRPVPGNTAKTLFLADILKEAD